MAERITIDPITRIEGHLRIEVEIAGGKVHLQAYLEEWARLRAAIAELVPDFRDQDFPVQKEVKSEKVFFLKKNGKIGFPIAPPPMKNHGNYIASLGRMVRWMAQRAEAAGIEW